MRENAPVTISVGSISIVRSLRSHGLLYQGERRCVHNRGGGYSCSWSTKSSIDSSCEAVRAEW